MCCWGGGGRQCLVLRGTRVPPSCKWEPVKRGRLPVPGGMRRPPGTGRLPSSYCSSCLVDKAMIFIIQIVIFIITKPIPPGPGRFLSRWPTFCHHFINDWLLSSLSWSWSGLFYNTKNITDESGNRPFHFVLKHQQILNASMNTVQ